MQGTFKNNMDLTRTTAHFILCMFIVASELEG